MSKYYGFSLSQGELTLYLAMVAAVFGYYAWRESVNAKNAARRNRQAFREAGRAIAEANAEDTDE